MVEEYVTHSTETTIRGVKVEIKLDEDQGPLLSKGDIRNVLNIFKEKYIRGIRAIIHSPEFEVGKYFYKKNKIIVGHPVYGEKTSKATIAILIHEIGHHIENNFEVRDIIKEMVEVKPPTELNLETKMNAAREDFGWVLSFLCCKELGFGGKKAKSLLQEELVQYAKGNKSKLEERFFR